MSRDSAQATVLVAATPQSAPEITAVVEAADTLQLAGLAHTGELAIERLQAQSVDIVLIEMSLGGLSGVKLAEWISIENLQCVPVLFGAHAGAPDLRRALLAGAREFIEWPCSALEIEQSLARVAQLTKNARYTEGDDIHAVMDSNAGGRVYVVIGAKGGIGTSFIAANLAAAYARCDPGRTVLVDFNLGSADLATILNVDAQRTLSDLLSAIAELDSELLGAARCSTNLGFDFFAGPLETGPTPAIPAESCRQLIDAWRHQYETVVIDGGAAMDETTVGLLEAADVIIPVVVPEVVCIRAAARLARLLDRLGLNRSSIKMLLNREEKRSLSAEHISRYIGLSVMIGLPESPVARSCLDEGRLIGREDDSNLYEAFSALVEPLGLMRTKKVFDG